MKPYTKHEFSPVIQEKLKQVMQSQRTSNLPGLYAVFEDHLLIWSSIFIVLKIQSIFGTFHSLTILSYCLSVLIIGAKFRAFAVCLHWSAHGTLTPNKTLNYALGTYLSSYLILQSWSGYYYSHVTKHHSKLGSLQDPDLTPILEAGLYEENREKAKSNFVRYVITLPIRVPDYVSYLVKNRMWQQNEDTKERAQRICYYLLILAVLTNISRSTNMPIFCYLALFWMVPMISTYPWIGTVVELVEHYPYCSLLLRKHDVDVDELYLSRNRILGAVANFLIGSHGESWHLIHHLLPNIPFWTFDQVHNIMMEDEKYSQLVCHKKTGVYSLIADFFEEPKNGETSRERSGSSTGSELSSN